MYVWQDLFNRLHSNLRPGRHLVQDITCPRVDAVLAVGAVSVSVGDELRETPDAVAAHLRLAAVRVPDPHRVVVIAIARG